MPPRVNPLFPNAAAYQREVEARRQQALLAISRLPIAALVWGPNPSAGTPVADARVCIREALEALGHIADFSEDLIDSASPLSIFAQQMAHVEAADIVFSLPDAPGSIAEIHGFARLPYLGKKIITFVDERWNAGFANQALMQLRSIATCDVHQYDVASLPGCVVSHAVDAVRRLQETHYALGRRA